MDGVLEVHFVFLGEPRYCYLNGYETAEAFDPLAFVDEVYKYRFTEGFVIKVGMRKRHTSAKYE